MIIQKNTTTVKQPAYCFNKLICYTRILNVRAWIDDENDPVFYEKIRALPERAE